MATTSSTLEAVMAFHSAPSLRNSRPEAAPAKREVAVATVATRMSGELYAMRRQLAGNPALASAIAQVEKALIAVQIEAGAVRVQAA